MKKTTPFALLIGTVFGLGSVTYAFAADAVLEEDPAPPEPVVEAAPAGGWYIGARIGGAFEGESDFGIAGATVSNEYDPGLDFSGAVGYEFKNDSPVSYRLEGELGYNSFDIDTHTVSGVGTFSGANAFGEASSIYGLANAYIDYDLGLLSPYVSAGIGYAQLDLDGQGTNPGGVVLSDDDGGLAYQAGAGASYALSDTLKLDLGYRYQAIDGVSLTALDGTNSDVDLTTHKVTLGFRKSF